MRRIARNQQRKRQTWLALPASGIEELGHGQISTGTISQSSAEAPGGRREGIAAQGQAGYRAGHGAYPTSRPGADHQRGLADRHHEDGFDGGQRTDRVLAVSAPRNRD